MLLLLLLLLLLASLAAAGLWRRRQGAAASLELGGGLAGRARGAAVVSVVSGCAADGVRDGRVSAVEPWRRQQLLLLLLPLLRLRRMVLLRRYPAGMHKLPS